LVPVIWGLNNKGKTTFVSPVPYMHYVKGHSHVAFNGNYGTVLNKLSFSLAHSGMVITIMIIKRWLKIKEKLSRKAIRDVLRHNKTIYTISPTLFSRPDHWNENLKVLGYHSRTEKTDWTPDSDLKDFLEKHRKIIFITFGSMTNPEPGKITRIMVDILGRNKIPAIINTASGGLVRPGQFEPEWIHFVSHIPYDWIFPKMYGVIHHGGSGTTHMGLKYGCVTMVIPHIIDQFVWNKIICEKGLGPKGIKVGKITTKRLEPKIIDLIKNSSYKEKARLVSSQMENEDFTEELYRTITE
jgi:UDP:flavonoid glycosyltransferase YjiC (YdhE family)